MSEEFTILKAEPLDRCVNRKPKSVLRLQIESLQPGEALQWRPKADRSTKSAYSTSVSVRESHGYKLTVRKVDGGVNIYRTA